MIAVVALPSTSHAQSNRDNEAQQTCNEIKIVERVLHSIQNAWPRKKLEELKAEFETFSKLMKEVLCDKDANLDIDDEGEMEKLEKLKQSLSFHE